VQAIPGASLWLACTGGGVCKVEYDGIINDTRTTSRAAMPSTPARLTMSRSLAKVIRASCADVSRLIDLDSLMKASSRGSRV
jgi:hypothetical protein